MTITYTVGASLYINMTNRCNCDCTFCVRNSPDEVYGSLWLEREPTLDEIMADIATRDLGSYENIVFCGYGEPTLRWNELLQVATAIKQSSSTPIRLNTNGLAGLIVGNERISELSGAVDIVSISLNAPNAAEYARISRPIYGESAFDALLDFAREAKKHVTSVVFTVVEGTMSDVDLQTCHDLAHQVGVTLRVREII